MTPSPGLRGLQESHRGNAGHLQICPSICFQAHTHARARTHAHAHTHTRSLFLGRALARTGKNDARAPTVQHAACRMGAPASPAAVRKWVQGRGQSPSLSKGWEQWREGPASPLTRGSLCAESVRPCCLWAHRNCGSALKPSKTPGQCALPPPRVDSLPPKTSTQGRPGVSAVGRGAVGRLRAPGAGCPCAP